MAARAHETVARRANKIRQPSEGLTQCRQSSARHRRRKNRFSTIRRFVASSIRSCSSLIVGYLFYDGSHERRREPSAREDRLRLRLPEQHRRLRHQPDADPLQRCRLDLWRCLHRRPAEHPARLGHRHRSSRRSSASSVGIARLSKNWMVAKVAMVYVETLRNIPLLLQLLFWYIAVLGPLPQPRNSLELRRRLLPQFARPLHGRVRSTLAMPGSSAPRSSSASSARSCFAAGPRSGRSRPAGNILSAR